MDLFVRAVEAVRIEAGVDQIVLVGHSMGTPVIRQYAITYPARIKALVLVDGLVQVAGGFGSGPRSQPPLIGAAGLRARQNFVASMFSEATTPALRERIRSMMLSTPEDTAAGAYLATWDTSTWRNDPVAMPVLGIYADASTLSNPEAMALLYPNLEYHEISGTGHFLMMEKPDEFNRLLRSFLNRLE